MDFLGCTDPYYRNLHTTSWKSKPELANEEGITGESCTICKDLSGYNKTKDAVQMQHPTTPTSDQ